MFKHLLVPLDGSRLAESALPAAAYLAQALGASVTLLHIIERNAPKEIHSERHLTNSDEAMIYLREIAERSFPGKIKVVTHIHTTQVSDVAHSIADHAEELTPDLVILCTHGRSGMRDLLFGSIAQQVIGLRETPVLLIRPEENASASPFTCKKLLLPLDSNPEHEQGIPVALGLAQALGAEVHLVMVVPTYTTLTGEQAATSRLLPGSTAVMLDLAEQGGEEYLRLKLAQLQAKVAKLTAEVVRGETVTAIVETADREEADLIVLGTHGKKGTDAFWSGSVSPKISGRTKVPLLLVPVAEK